VRRNSDSLSSGDADGDGVCTDEDCDDGDENNTETDKDGDGVCTPDDCDDDDSDIYPGAPCDDGDPATINDAYDASCDCIGSAQATFTDVRDGQIYFKIDIGNQTWMAENLNYETGTSNCYADMETNCEIYGRLYDFETALDACPDGWHLPTEAEWVVLTDFLGGVSIAGGKLKEAGFDHWSTPNEGATNESGFTSLPGGYQPGSGNSQILGDQAFIWSATIYDGQNGKNMNMTKSTTIANITPSSKTNRLSVRCIED